MEDIYKIPRRQMSTCILASWGLKYEHSLTYWKVKNRWVIPTISFGEVGAECTDQKYMQSLTFDNHGGYIYIIWKWYPHYLARLGPNKHRTTS